MSKQPRQPAAPPVADLSPARAEVLLRRVEVAVSRRLTGRLPGTHPAVGRGEGLEPESARPYEPGVDDVRFMDWAVTARTGTAHVRQHVPERELDALAVVDRSPSMAFGTIRWRKQDLAAAVVAAVGVLTARPGDRLGALLFGEGPQPVRWPPRAGRVARLQLLRRLLAEPAAPGQPGRGGRAGRADRAGDAAGPALDLAGALQVAQRQLLRRSLVVVTSDLLDDPASWAPALRRIARRHDTLVVEVVDPREVELADVGLMSVRDPETGAGLSLDTGDPAVRRAYADIASEHATAVRAAVRGAGARHLRVGTGDDWVSAMARFVTAASAGPAERARSAGWPAAARGVTA